MAIDPYYQQQKSSPMNDSSFRKYKAYADIRGGSPGRRCPVTVGLLKTVIFVDLGGYFCGNVGDKASNITW